MPRYVDIECDAVTEVIGRRAFNSREDIREFLDNIPTADVLEVKHGKWDNNIIGFCNVCTECGAIVERTAIKNNSGKLNYCPNCGARMDGGDTK